MCILVDAYSSWQKRTNEIQMAWIREFFLKKFDFSTINQNHVDIVEIVLNNRHGNVLIQDTLLGK